MSDHLRRSIFKQNQVADRLQVHHAHLSGSSFDNSFYQSVKILICHDLSEYLRAGGDIVEETCRVILHLVLLLIDQFQAQTDHTQIRQFNCHFIGQSKHTQNLNWYPPYGFVLTEKWFGKSLNGSKGMQIMNCSLSKSRIIPDDFDCTGCLFVTCIWFHLETFLQQDNYSSKNLEFSEYLVRKLELTDLL